MTTRQNGAGSGFTPTPARTAIDRRAMLRGIGITGLGAMMAPGILGGATAADAATPNRATRRALETASSARANAQKKRRKTLVGDASKAQPGPFLLQATTELSRDFFLTDQVLIQSGDRIMPFVNPKNNNELEALVFAGGSLSHLYRDAGAPSGWAFQAFDLQGLFRSVTDVAVAANDSDVFVLIFGSPTEGNDYPAWRTRLTGPSSWDSGTLVSAEDLDYDPSLDPGGLKGGVSREGVCYFYSAFAEGNTTTLAGWVSTGDAYPGLAPVRYLEVDTSQHGIQDFVVLYDTTSSDVDHPTGFAGVLLDNGWLSFYPQDGLKFSTDPLDDAGGTLEATELMWAWTSPTSTTGLPGYAYQTADGTYFCDENGTLSTVTDAALAGNNEVVVWQQGGLYTVNLLDKDGTLQMIQELSSTGTGSWAAPIPLVPDLQAVFGVPTDPTESTLFAVGLDESLSVLSLGASGWTQQTVHQSSEELYDLAAYRVRSTVSDANGVVVPGVDVVIKTTDRPVGCWTPSGHLAVTPDAPALTTTDAQGEVTFSIPAEELDCATLIMEPLNADGSSAGPAILITPDTDVRGFLGGTGALTAQSPISGAAVQSATIPGSSTRVFGALGNSDAANASVQALSATVKVGTDALNNNTDRGKPFTLDLTSGQPSVSNSVSAKLEGRALTFSFGHLFATIGHALRHGAMELSKAVVRLADDAAGWVVDLAVKIGDDIVNFTDLVISDMKDAFHVIGGLFAALGADIEKAVKWLMHDVLALLDEAKSTASTLQGWLGADGVTSNVSDVLTNIEFGVDGWFSKMETQAHTAISNLKNEVEGTLGGPALPPPSTDTGSSSDQSGLSKDLGYIAHVMNDAPATWLLHKFMSYLPNTDPGPTMDQDTFLPVIQDLVNDWSDGLTFSENLADFAGTTLVDAFSSGGGGDKSSIEDAKITDWFTQLDNTVADGLQLMDQVADTLLDVGKAGCGAIQTYLDYQYNLVSSMGLLGMILELAGVDLKFSIDEIIAWIVAFPTTLIAKILGHDTVFPTTATSDATGRHASASVGADADGWQVGLGIAGAVTQGIWGFADLVGDLQALTDDNGKRGEPSGLIQYFDIICPVVETILLWPSDPNDDGTTAPPFTGTGHGKIAGSTKDNQYLPYVVLTAFLPSAVNAITIAPWSNLANKAGFPSGIQNVAKDYVNPITQFACGVVSTVLGALYSDANGAGTTAIVGTVLGNLSNVFAPMGTYWMNSTTDDVSTMVKMLIDAGGNIGAAVCIAEASSLPTP